MDLAIGKVNEPVDWRDIVQRQVPPLRDIGPFAARDVFFGGPRSEAAFGGEQGLAQGPSFTPAELHRIQELIRTQLIDWLILRSTNTTELPITTT
jgi:hypothetical protein